MSIRLCFIRKSGSLTKQNFAKVEKKFIKLWSWLYISIVNELLSSVTLKMDTIETCDHF